MSLSGLACAWSVVLLMDMTVFGITFVKGTLTRRPFRGRTLSTMLRDGRFSTIHLSLVFDF